ncbi:phytase [Methylobacillus rhizosphaerae]|nr:phytase [Methylobacillus rhizosphaerae]
MSRLKNKLFFALLLLLPVWGGQAAEIKALPALKQDFHEVAALPDGRWLALDKHAVRLLDKDGRQQDSLDVRAQHLDTRVTEGGMQAVVFDADHQQPWILQVGQQKLQVRTKLAPVMFALETLCLYQDAQQLSHVFLIAKDGMAEQWLLSGKSPQLFRRLALPPGVEHCRVDDSRQALYVSEPGLGVWRYDANGEGVPERDLILGRQPYGVLMGAAGALAVLPSGLAVLDATAGKVHILGAHGKSVKPVVDVPGAHALAVSGRDVLIGGKQRWQALVLGDMPHVSAGREKLPVIVARGQTATMARAGDAADDPAIWIHPQSPAQSRIIATNKKQGLLSYDLKGKQLQLLEAGRLNNVDVRQNISWPGSKVDLAVATQRDEAAIAVFEIDGQGNLRDVARIKTGLEDIYGTCLFQPAAGGLEVFANDKDGRFEHYRIERQGKRYEGKLLRGFRAASQPEGCVVDDSRQRLFFGEEKRGIWTLSANAENKGVPQLILPVGEYLKADVEGMAIYHGKRASYLLASSQGNSSFVVLDAQAPYTYRGAFRIGINAQAGIDGVSDTDGLEVSAVNFGTDYRYGLLVVQDGYKRLPDGTQNFKYVAWEDVARALNLE